MTLAAAPAGPALRRRTEAGIVLRIGAANLAGAGVVFTYFTFLSTPLVAAGGPPTRADRVQAVAVFVLFLAVVVPLAFRRVLHVFRPVARWLDEGRTPGSYEQIATLLQPWLHTVWTFSYWAAAAVIFGAVEVGLVGQPPLEGVRVGMGTLVGGLTTSAIGYLLVERRLRPVFALALAGGAAPLPSALGVRPQILLSWAVGSGVPLAIIALVPIGRRVAEQPVDLVQVSFLASIGLVSGGLIMYLTARSLSERVGGVRAALRRVEQGDVQVRVPVDEGGEVGLLQSGFNRMVQGLAERQRLHDLFGRHVGEEVASRALEGGIGLHGEQREVSVLFVDLVGSTALAASRPAAEVVDVLNGLFGAVVGAAGEQGGWVNKFDGDGALCVFGAPADQPDHAARALRAAEDLRRRVTELARAEPALDVGIGVSSGTVVAGNVGAEERYEYTVVGDPVNEAARLTELAKTISPRTVASARAVRAAGNGAACWQYHDEILLRGRTGPTQVYALADAGEGLPDA